MFDVPEDSTPPRLDVSSENVSRLMQSLDVFINVRHKPKQCTLSIVVRGIERNATNIYEARKKLLGLTEPSITATIPISYHLANPTSFLQGNGAQLGHSSFAGMNGKYLCLEQFLEDHP